ncbi:TolC family protein [candidate division KSB1 bacterium]|nr:TolC family protein [candidate division KSB1 bacterium]MBL7093006.1 TolC family protein [candidate division KSB1 bacterium]
MYNRKYLWVLIITIIIPSLAGFTQDNLTLTLEKSVNYALKNNPEIKMAEKEVRKAKAGRLEAWSNILPRLNGSVNFQHAWDIQQQTIPNFLKPMLKPLEPYMPELALMPDYVTMSFGMRNTLFYGATVSQPVFLGGAGIAGIQIANSAKRAAEQNLEETKQSLIYNTTNVFYACLLSKELVKVQEEALAQTRANLDNVTKKYNVGSASGFDKMRAQVELANLKPEYITAKNNHQSAQTMLKTVLGLKRDTKIEVDGEFKYVEDDFGNMALDELQKLAYEHRPLIKALADQKYITKKGIKLAKSNFMPKLFFQTDYSFMLMKNDYKFRHAEASKGFTSALSLQIPLFHGFQSTALYQKSRLDYKIILDTEKQAFDGIAAETEVAYNKFKEAKEKYFSAVQTVDLAKEALRLATMMYEEGVNTQLDVMGSQLALTQAKLNYINSIYEYQISRYQLRKVVGMLKGVLGD